MDVLFPSCLSCDPGDVEGDDEGGDRLSLLGVVNFNDDVGSSLSFDLGDVGNDDEGSDCPSLLGVMDGDNDDVGFVFAYRSLNAEGGVAPTLPPPSILKKDHDHMGRSHDHAVGIDLASVHLLVADDHAMYSRSDDSRNVHNLGPSVDVCIEYRILVVLLACCHYQCQLQFHLLLLLPIQCFERSTSFSYHILWRHLQRSMHFPSVFHP